MAAEIDNGLDLPDDILPIDMLELPAEEESKLTRRDSSMQLDELFQKPVLVHYWSKLFSAKVRRMLAYKNLKFVSHDIAIKEPRPSLQALTGGYRRTPVLLYGNDLYCDTHIISHFIDWLSETNYCKDDKPICQSSEETRAQWEKFSFTEHELFSLVSGYSLSPAKKLALKSKVVSKVIGGIAKDRHDFMKNDIVESIGIHEKSDVQRDRLRRIIGEVNSCLRLSPGGTITASKDFKEIDFAIYHCLLWLFERCDREDFDECSYVDKWMESIAAFGGENFEDVERIDEETLFERTRTSKPTTPMLGEDAAPPHGFAIGETVTIRPTDYGLFASRGILRAVTDLEFAIEREDETAGTIMLHFPREGFELLYCSHCS